MATCEWVTLCERVDWETPDKPNVIGIVEGLVTNARLPSVCPRMAFFLELLGLPGEKAELTVRLFDPLGKNLEGGGETITFRGTTGTHPVKHRLALSLTNVLVEKAGNYRLDISLDGRHTRSLTFLLTSSAAKDERPRKH
jgi:hypothetical protein